MSSPVSTIDVAQAATGKEEPSPNDGWRTGGLPALRAELDRIDNAIHDLLMQRAEIVEYVARSGKPAAFRPGREASIIRRLVGRHQGALPPVALVRIWRELLAGTTGMQGGLSLAVCDSEAGVPLTQLAREHFGALTPLRTYAKPGQALFDVSQGAASVAILPYPSDLENWWVALLHQEPRLHIIARLPFWKPRPEGFPSAEALVVASAAPDASEQDQSFLGLECDSDVSRTKLSSELTAAGLKPETMVLIRQPGSPVANVLVEVEGFLSDDDDRLNHLGSVLRRPVVLGGYAVPLQGNTR
ncbi:MAG TPA: chorismate mutase [Acetobacteraceae bacterium]|jgi:chorismate mutase / prephenate dehydratase|nr:chorismate mutase [Acetobacteraceae bacterium]